MWWCGEVDIIILQQCWMVFEAFAKIIVFLLLTLMVCETSDCQCLEQLQVENSVTPNWYTLLYMLNIDAHHVLRSSVTI